MQRTKLKATITALWATAMCVMMIIFSDSAKSAANEALNTAFSSVLPVLIPYFILSNIIGLSMPQNKGKASLITAFVIGSLCGNPVGAVLTDRLFKQKAITKEQAAILLAACSHTSPAFSLCVVGQGLFGSGRFGLFLWLFSVIPASLAIIYLLKRCNNSAIASTDTGDINISQLIGTSSKNAVVSAGAVAVLMTFFSVIGIIIKKLFSLSDVGYGMLAAILEIGSGTAACAELSYPLSAAMAAFSTVFCGFSVFFQICVCCPDVPKTPYMISKTLLAVTIFVIILFKA